MRKSPYVLPCLGALLLLAWLTAPDTLDAKRKKRSSSPPLTIVSVTPTPVPFMPGPGSSLALAVTVELPKRLDGLDVIEVSSLISFPSKRSIRFLFDRQPLDNVAMQDGKPRKRLILRWDGKDQHHQYVRPGKYAYAVRAKLMAREHGVVKSKIVSLFARGTVEVSPPDTVEHADTTEPAPRPDSATPTDADADAGSRPHDDARPAAAGQLTRPTT